MTEQMEQMIFNEGYRRGKAERHKILDDGTLVVSVDDATKVTRVLVEDDKKNGDLFYNDRPKGKWYQIKDHVIMGEGYLWHCSLCYHRVYQDSSADYPTENFCPNCGADMRPKGDDDV